MNDLLETREVYKIKTISKELSLYQELVKNKKVLIGLTDPVFKRVMTSHKEYLGLI